MAPGFAPPLCDGANPAASCVSSRRYTVYLLSPMCLPLAPRAHTTHSPSRVTLRAVHGVARFVFQRWTCHATRRARKREQLRDSADWNAVRLMSDCLRDQNDPETFLAGGPAEVCECVAHMIVLYIFAHPSFCPTGKCLLSRRALPH